MIMKKRPISPLPFLFLAFALTYTYRSDGQHAELADLGSVPNRDQLATKGEAKAPISDDGRESDALVSAEQLVIAFLGEDEVPLTVEILDEQGVCVQRHAFTGHAGRNHMPINVAGLAHGRYAVRVSDAGSSRISRFMRD